MATVEIIIRDEHGNILESADKRLYALDIGNGSFHAIEGAVEAFKHAALSAIEHDLLRQRQEKFTEDIKKSGGQLSWHNANDYKRAPWQSFVTGVDKICESPAPPLVHTTIYYTCRK